MDLDQYLEKMITFCALTKYARNKNRISDVSGCVKNTQEKRNSFYFYLCLFNVMKYLALSFQKRSESLPRLYKEIRENSFFALTPSFVPVP